MHTKEKILAGARDYLVKYGQAGFTVRAVAKEADVNPGLVHHYFGSKDNLIFSLLEAESSSMLEKGRRIKAEMGNDAVREALLDGFFTNIVVGQLFVEAIILTEKSEKVKAKLRELISSRREFFTDLMGVSNPVDKVLVQATLFGLQLLKKVEPVVDIEEAINRFYSTVVVNYLMESEEARSDR